MRVGEVPPVLHVEHQPLRVAHEPHALPSRTGPLLQTHQEGGVLCKVRGVGEGCRQASRTPVDVGEAIAVSPTGVIYLGSQRVDMGTCASAQVEDEPAGQGRGIRAAHGLEHPVEIHGGVEVVVVKVGNDLAGRQLHRNVPLQADGPSVAWHGEVAVDHALVRCSELRKQRRRAGEACVHDHELLPVHRGGCEAVVELAVEGQPLLRRGADDTNERRAPAARWPRLRPPRLLRQPRGVEVPSG
mmetsp:Transcript_77821/g.231840  ORF Transcript_77821/g.231840 Transcript_77821/m.231840 type:complete len:243 (-) Transcript_77821:104-832(-)